MHSYNRYLAVASRVVRRSLKDDKRLLAERRGEQELRFSKWTVSLIQGGVNRGSGPVSGAPDRFADEWCCGCEQNGKQGELKNLAQANAAASAEAASSS